MAKSKCRPIFTGAAGDASAPAHILSDISQNDFGGYIKFVQKVHIYKVYIFIIIIRSAIFITRGDIRDTEIDWRPLKRLALYWFAILLYIAYDSTDVHCRDIVHEKCLVPTPSINIFLKKRVSLGT